jgi:hypothetical protein
MSIQMGNGRRRFLARAGGLATLLPFLRKLIPAAHAAPIRRMVLLMQANGTVIERWRPSGGSGLQFPMNSIMTPLQAHKDALILVDAMRINNGYGENHVRGYTGLWPGVSAVGTNRENPIPGGQSLDYHVAAGMAAGTRYPVLNLGVLAQKVAGGRSAFARSATDPVAPFSDPVPLYQQVFASLPGGAGMGAAAADRAIAEKRSILDSAIPDLQALSARLAGTERTKMDAHLAALRDLEKGLSAAVAVGCQPPGASTATTAFDKAAPLIEDALIAAFTCDLTRIATMQWGQTISAQTFSWLGQTKAWHPMSHDPGTFTEELVAIDRWLASRVARLMDRLKAIPEGGGTMLDNTVIAWGNELGRGTPHVESDCPILIAGGRGMGIKTGQYLKLPQQLSTNALLVTLCQAMGIAPKPAWGSATIPGAL